MITKKKLNNKSISIGHPKINTFLLINVFTFSTVSFETLFSIILSDGADYKT